MAKQGAKKRKEDNEKHIQMLQQLIVYVNVAYILIRVSFFFSTFSLLHWGGLLCTTLLYKFCFDQLVHMATPLYDDKGSLMDGGSDLNAGGPCAYLHDIIYITAFVQVTTMISDWFWLVYLLVPLFGFYKLATDILYPLYLQRSQPDNETEDEKAKKKREKMERKAARNAKLMQQRR